MIRNIAGLAIFAFISMTALKLFLGFFGWLMGLLFTVLTWALIGFVIYTLLRIFAPDLALRLRSILSGEGRETAHQ